MADHGIGLAEALLGLDGFRVLEVTEGNGELIVRIETTSDVVVCEGCGRRAEAQDRVERAFRDLPCFGRSVRLEWRKRRWRCRFAECAARTWTEIAEHTSTRTVLTKRAGWEMCRQVGANARPVAQLAREFGVEWWTAMNAVIEHGTPLVDDPDRVGTVTTLGLDETSFLKANRRQPTQYVTGFVDLDRKRMIDLVEGNDAKAIDDWLDGRDPQWRKQVETVATSSSPTATACRRIWTTPSRWRIRFMSSEQGTGVSTRSAAASRTKRSSIGAARTTRCTRSVSSC